MKILSKFQDYYDPFQFGNGEDVYYDRNMNLRYLDSIGIILSSPDILECNKIFQKYLQNNMRDVDLKQRKTISTLTFNIIFIGNKIIPYCIMHYGDYFSEKVEYTNIFSLDDLELIDKWYLSNSKIKYIKEHLNKNYQDLFNKIREVSKEPIISYSSYKTNSNISEYITMKSGTTLNPSLKELGLSKIIDPLQVIQELELFIKENITVEKEVQFSNELKIQNAGFDKNSFRNKRI